MAGPPRPSSPAPTGHLDTIENFANLVLSESLLAAGRIDFPPAELFARVRPYGGLLFLAGQAGPPPGWETAVPGLARDTVPGSPGQPGLPGAGNWTHMFADAANTSCSGDQLVGGTGYRLQWFGDPSPPRNAGWHANGLGPLYRDGRLLVIKIDHVEAVDAYNGMSLWSAEVPGSTRFSPAREGGAACVDESRLYFAAGNDC